MSNTKQKPTKKKSVEWLKYTLTEAELQEVAKELAQGISQKHRLEGELESVKKKFKSDIDKTEHSISSNSEVINCGYEMRRVDCEIIYRWDDDRKDLVRTDTGEVVWSRKIDPSERQQEIK